MLDTHQDLMNENAALRNKISNLEITIDTLNERRAVLKIQQEERIRELEAHVDELQAQSNRGGALAPQGLSEDDQGKVVADLECQLRDEREKVRELEARLAETMGENQILRVTLEDLTTPVSIPDHERGGGRGEGGYGRRDGGEMSGGGGVHGSMSHGHGY